MPINLFNELNNRQQNLPNNMPNLQPMFQQFMHNPMQFMVQHKLNIPQEYANDPRSAIEYLVKSGQRTQGQYNWIMQMANQMGIKL